MSRETEKSSNDTFREKLISTADKRARYTREYFTDSNKSLDKFVADLKNSPFKIDIDPQDDVSLTTGIANLQKTLGFPEKDIAKGCDGKCGPYTYYKFEHADVVDHTKHEITQIAAEIPAIPTASVRNTEVAKEKLADVHFAQALFVGDSFTVMMMEHMAQAKSVSKIGRQTSWMKKNLSAYLKENASYIKRVVIFGGINDIDVGHSADKIANNLREMIAMAHEHGISAVLCTIPQIPMWFANAEDPTNKRKMETVLALNKIIPTLGADKIIQLDETGDQKAYFGKTSSNRMHPTGSGTRTMVQKVREFGGIIP